MTDKNGTKIFEGDICEIDREDGRFEIIWDNPYARVALVSDELYFDFDHFYLNEIRVIGNMSKRERDRRVMALIAERAGINKIIKMLGEEPYA